MVTPTASLRGSVQPEPPLTQCVGGVIIHFRLAAMPYDAAAHSLRLFAEKVAPQFRLSARA